jgi:hypothetical protein
MSNRRIPEEVWRTIAALGFDVYAPSDPYWQSYLFYTDGTRIGYMEGGFEGWRLSTVHVPNRITGTGFSLHSYGESAALTKEELEAAFAIAPPWASNLELASVRKWPSLEAFLKGRSLTLVAKGERV